MSSASPTSPTVAVIDIGSNTIKLLVASASPTIQSLYEESFETRLLPCQDFPDKALGEKQLQAALKSISQLLTAARKYSPAKTQLTATHAVRKASNRKAFAARVQEQTGLPLRILAGREEALYIGKGLRQDPALSPLASYHLADLGGGSIEQLYFQHRKLQRAASLSLGAIHLTRKYLPDPSAPLLPPTAHKIVAHLKRCICKSGIDPSQGRHPLICTGGSASIARLILAQQEGKALRDSSHRLPLHKLMSLYESVAPLALSERCKIPLLPSSRADIFPAGLLSLITLGEIAGQSVLHHSFYNLRYGLAAEMLSQLKQNG